MDVVIICDSPFKDAPRLIPQISHSSHASRRKLTGGKLRDGNLSSSRDDPKQGGPPAQEQSKFASAIPGWDLGPRRDP